MFSRLFNLWARWQACKLAATVISGWTTNTNDAMCPQLWSVTVFFESYLNGGADGTQEDFGPKEPATLTIVPQEIKK